MTAIDRLLETAVEQRGYVTTLDAENSGVAAATLRKLAQRGKLTRIAQGLYRLTAFPYREYDDLMRAALWPRNGGVISHQTALLLWDLADVNPKRIDVTVQPPYRPRRRGGEKYRVWVRELGVAETDYVDGIPVTVPGRAIRDAIDAGLQQRFAEQAIENAIKLHYIDESEAASIRLGLQPNATTR